MTQRKPKGFFWRLGRIVQQTYLGWNGILGGIARELGATTEPKKDPLLLEEAPADGPQKELVGICAVCAERWDIIVFDKKLSKFAMRGHLDPSGRKNCPGSYQIPCEVYRPD